VFFLLNALPNPHCHTRQMDHGSRDGLRWIRGWRIIYPIELASLRDATARTELYTMNHVDSAVARRIQVYIRVQPIAFCSIVTKLTKFKDD
jgi:hypothetical protein